MGDKVVFRSLHFQISHTFFFFTFTVTDYRRLLVEKGELVQMKLERIYICCWVNKLILCIYLFITIVKVVSEPPR